MTVTFLPGDCLDSLKTLADQSVNCCVTSPPYFGLRDYQTGTNQIGLDSTPEAYIDRLVAVFAEVKRVLRDDGILWVNIGDSYSRNPSKGGGGPNGKNKGRWGCGDAKRALTQGSSDGGVRRGDRPAFRASGAKEKDLIGIPWMLAFALRADGWYLRQDIIWNRPNVMPESIKDRCTKAHEYVFMLTKQPRYYFDSFAMQEPAVTPAGTKGAKGSKARAAEFGVNGRPPEYAIYDGTRNRRSVWTIQTRPFKEAHFATFPPTLVEPMIAASLSEYGYCRKCGEPYTRVVRRDVPDMRVESSTLDRYGSGDAGVHRKVGQKYQDWMAANPKKTVSWKKNCSCGAQGTKRGVVLDPFGGAGTVSLVAEAAGHDSIMCELNPKYIRIAKRRLGVTLSIQEKIAELNDALDGLNAAILEDAA